MLQHGGAPCFGRQRSVTRRRTRRERNDLGEVITVERGDQTKASRLGSERSSAERLPNLIKKRKPGAAQRNKSVRIVGETEGESVEDPNYRQLSQ